MSIPLFNFVAVQEKKSMQTLVFILWRIGALWSAIIRSAKKTVVRVMAQKGYTTGKAGRQVVPTGYRCPYAGRRFPFLKYAPYIARDGIRHPLPNRKAGAVK
jgi:hypothetical protein